LDVVAKRTRSSRRLVDLNSDATGDGLDPDVDFSTPELSATASTSPSSSSPSPPPPPIQPTLTRRQRKALGVPKQRSVLVSRGGRGAGKIIIPPGRYKRSAGAREGRQEDEHDEQEDASVDAEWTRNGNGRLDVRGFRELKI
jgi:OTU domain-containing protein 3